MELKELEPIAVGVTAYGDEMYGEKVINEVGLVVHYFALSVTAGEECKDDPKLPSMAERMRELYFQEANSVAVPFPADNWLIDSEGVMWDASDVAEDNRRDPPLQPIAELFSKKTDATAIIYDCGIVRIVEDDRQTQTIYRMN